MEEIFYSVKVSQKKKHKQQEEGKIIVSLMVWK